MVVLFPKHRLDNGLVIGLQLPHQLLKVPLSSETEKESTTLDISTLKVISVQISRLTLC